MKKTMAMMILLSLCLPLFSLEVGVGGGLCGNARTDADNCFMLSIGDERNSFSSFLHGGDVLSLSFSHRGNFTHSFGWRLGSALGGYSYGATSLLLDAVVGGEYGTEYVNLKGSFGVQAAAVKYRSLDEALFTLSPLVSVILELVAEDNVFHFYMSYTMPYERQAKAVPSFGFEY
ncbi:MAG: hypothetical protein ACI4S4_02780, partial [Candidatus Ornithospirochaeta sp.]